MDETIFDDFFVFEYPRLVAALTLVTGDGDVARDAVDEACARAWERVRRNQPIDALGAWVRVVALNVARGRFRRRATERRAQQRLGAAASATTSTASSVDSALAIDVARALATLPRRQREVVVMHYFLDVAVDDVATQLGVSGGTVKTSLHRARAALAIRLGDTNDEVLDGIA
ncbi:MAG: polymerase sigma factor [Actinomycetia bacterium]|nr:polymerase sigma factor [Actinomycetes bacterium]